jgi:hypothetical protein
MLTTFVFAVERLLTKVNITLQLLSKIMSQIDSAFAETGGLSGFSTGFVVSTKGTSPAPLDKGSQGAGQGVSP